MKSRFPQSDLFPSRTTTMGRTNSLVSCLLLITLSGAFLGSGRLSKIHFGYFQASAALSCLQIRVQGECVVGVCLDFLRLQPDVNHSWVHIRHFLQQFQNMRLKSVTFTSPKARKEAYLTEAMDYDLILNILKVGWSMTLCSQRYVIIHVSGVLTPSIGWFAGHFSAYYFYTNAYNKVQNISRLSVFFRSMIKQSKSF